MDRHGQTKIHPCPQNVTVHSCQICEIISKIKYLGGPVKTKNLKISGGESGAQIGLVANQFKKKLICKSPFQRMSQPVNSRQIVQTQQPKRENKINSKKTV